MKKEDEEYVISGVEMEEFLQLRMLRNSLVKIFDAHHVTNNDKVRLSAVKNPALARRKLAKFDGRADSFITAVKKELLETMR